MIGRQICQTQLRQKHVLRPETQESVKSTSELGAGDNVLLKWHLSLGGELEGQTCFFNSTVMHVQGSHGADVSKPGELMKPQIILPESLKLGIGNFRN